MSMEDCLERRVIRPGIKSKSEQEKPVSKQRGSVQCQRCKGLFCSKGGLAVHS